MTEGQQATAYLVRSRVLEQCLGGSMNSFYDFIIVVIVVSSIAFGTFRCWIKRTEHQKERTYINQLPQLVPDLVEFYLYFKC